MPSLASMIVVRAVGPFPFLLYAFSHPYPIGFISNFQLEPNNLGRVLEQCKLNPTSLPPPMIVCSYDDDRLSVGLTSTTFLSLQRWLYNTIGPTSFSTFQNNGNGYLSQDLQ